MINEVYQLIAPKLIDTAYKEIDLSKNEVILRPVKMSICKADQRYYQGLRQLNILMKKLRLAVKQTGIKHVAVAGGVSANTGLRNAFVDHAKRYHWNIYIPKFSYTTDNAAMIGITGYFKYLDKDFCPIDAPAFSKVTFK